MSATAHMEVGPVRRPDLRGRVALIANGSEPLGGEIARRLALHGATVALCGGDRQKLNTVATEVAANGAKALVISPDRSEGGGISELQNAIRENLKNIDIFINNVPEIQSHSLADFSMADFANNIGMILQNSLALLQTSISIMRQEKYGRVINIFNLAYLGLPGQIDIATAYAGIFGLSRSAALETARDGITINSIVKGDVIATDQPIDEVTKIVARIPVRRIGEVEDLAHAIRYLASPETAYVTGQTLFVCGGRSIHFSLSV